MKIKLDKLNALKLMTDFYLIGKESGHWHSIGDIVAFLLIYENPKQTQGRLLKIFFNNPENADRLTYDKSFFRRPIERLLKMGFIDFEDKPLVRKDAKKPQKLYYITKTGNKIILNSIMKEGSSESSLIPSFEKFFFDKAKDNLDKSSFNKIQKAAFTEREIHEALIKPKGESILNIRKK